MIFFTHTYENVLNRKSNQRLDREVDVLIVKIIC